MKYILKSFHLEASSGLGRYPRPDLIAPLLEELPATLQDTVRMGFLQSSRAKGRVSQSLKDAASVQFVGVSAHGKNGTAVTFRVPRFGDAAPALFEQGQFWADLLPSASITAFDLLGVALTDVQAQRTDSTHFDQPFLKRIGGYQRLLKHGITRISLEDTATNSPHIDAEVVKRADDLSRATPDSRRVRVTGRLDLMGASQGVLKLHLRPGEFVTALWSGSDPIESHREFFNRDVIVEGLGVFRPSGSLLRIEADAIAPATIQDDFFRKLPVATSQSTDYLNAARLRPGEKSAYALIRGSVPAEESDEAFIEALSKIR